MKVSIKIIIIILYASMLSAQKGDFIEYNGKYSSAPSHKQVNTLWNLWNEAVNGSESVIEIECDSIIFESGTSYTDATDLTFSQTSHLYIDRDLTIRGESYNNRPVITHNKDVGDYYLYWMFEVRDSINVTFQNLKFDGQYWRSDFGTGSSQTTDNTQMHGINIGGSEVSTDRTWSGINAVIDSCEFTRFPNSGVAISANSNVEIKNSYFHHNLKTGAGYGISIHKNPITRIHNCVFDSNRHNIQHYCQNDAVTDIYFNDFYEHGISGIGQIDHHGNALSPPFSGGKTTIRNNTFYDGETYITYLYGSSYTGLYIYENRFLGHEWLWFEAGTTSNLRDSTDYRPLVIGESFPSGYTTESKAQTQNGGVFFRNYDGTKTVIDGTYGGVNIGKNVFISNNYYREKQFSYDYLTFQVQYNDSTNNPNWNRLASFGYASSYPNSIYPTDSLGFGDFNGDGVTDIITHYFESEVKKNYNQWVFTSDNFRTYDSTHYMISFGGITDWLPLRNNDYLISDLDVADVDGDGKSDLIYNQSTYSSGGTGTWTALPEAFNTYTLYTKRDFNGDGIDDPYRISSD